jgi:transcriptional regulator of acetoin/glycerol metabolism
MGFAFPAHAAAYNGNVSQSALELGVRRTYLHRRMAVLKINKKDYFV